MRRKLILIPVFVLTVVTLISCGDKVSRHLEKAEEYRNTLKLELAIEEYEAAVEANPGSFESYWGIVTCSNGLDSLGFSLRIRNLKDTYEKKDFDVRGLKPFIMGIIDFHQGLHFQAEKHLSKALEENADEPFIMFALGRNSEMKGDLDSATEIYRGIIEDYPEFYPAYTGLIIAYNIQGKYSEAIDFIESHSSPKFPKRHRVTHSVVKGTAYFGSDNMEAAEEIIEYAKKKEARTPGEYGIIVQYLLDRDKIKEARELAEYVVEKFDEEPLGYLMLGDTYLINENYSKAAENYKKASELGSDFVAYRVGVSKAQKEQARSCFNGANYYGAVAYYKDALKLYTEDYESRYGLGRAYIYLENYDDAIREFEYIINNAPNPVLGYDGLGQTYWQMGLPVLASNAQEKVLEVEPENKQIRHKLALSLTEGNRFDEAEALLQKGLEIDPEFISFYISLGYVYCAVNNPERDTDKAIEILNSGIRNCAKAGVKDLAATHFMLAAAYMFKTEENLSQPKTVRRYKDLALSELEKAIELDRSNPDYLDAYDRISKTE